MKLNRADPENTSFTQAKRLLRSRPMTWPWLGCEATEPTCDSRARNHRFLSLDRRSWSRRGHRTSYKGGLSQRRRQTMSVVDATHAGARDQQGAAPTSRPRLHSRPPGAVSRRPAHRRCFPRGFRRSSRRASALMVGTKRGQSWPGLVITKAKAAARQRRELGLDAFRALDLRPAQHEHLLAGEHYAGRTSDGCSGPGRS
jgi:hypothetical protein